MARGWFLRRRPAGVPEASDFELRDLPQTPLAAEMVRVRNRWLSVDPYVRGRMNDTSRGPNPEMDGPAVGIVIESMAPKLPVGALVRHRLGWRDEAVGAAATFEPLSDLGLPEILFLGPLGSSGMTGYFGLLEVAKIKAGDRLFVSSAAGAVGSVVVQVARDRGAHVIASAGGAEKCRFLKEIGADVVIDRLAPGSMTDKLREAAPEGIDAFFDNVGGDHLEAAINAARLNARFALCGMIARYNDEAPLLLSDPMRIISARIRIQGFAVGDFAGRKAEFETDMAAMLKRGAVVAKDTLFEGLEAMPEAFIGLFTGHNAGKAIVQV